MVICKQIDDITVISNLVRPLKAGTNGTSIYKHLDWIWSLIYTQKNPKINSRHGCIYYNKKRKFSSSANKIDKYALLHQLAFHMDLIKSQTPMLLIESLVSLCISCSVRGSADSSRIKKKDSTGCRQIGHWNEIWLKQSLQTQAWRQGKRALVTGWSRHMMHSSCCCCDGNECTVFVFCCTGVTGAEGCGAGEFIGVVSIGSSVTPDSYSRY